jgi:hypothetical protein
MVLYTMALFYKGASIEVVLGNTIVYAANNRKHICVLCMCGKRFCSVSESSVYNVVLMGLNYRRLLNQIYLR